MLFDPLNPKHLLRELGRQRPSPELTRKHTQVEEGVGSLGSLQGPAGRIIEKALEELADPKAPINQEHKPLVPDFEY